MNNNPIPSAVFPARLPWRRMVLAALCLLALAVTRPPARAAEIEVDECAAPNGS